MPTIEELIAQFSFLAATPAVMAVAIAAATLVMFRDWRLSVLGLGAQAVFAGLLFTLLLPPRIAGVKLVVGLFVTLIYYNTGQWLARFNAAPADPPRLVQGWYRVLPHPRLLFRLFAVLLVALASWQTAPQIQNIFSTPNHIALGGSLLIGLGLLNLGLSEAPFRTGLGLITVLMGFELFYAAIEPALAVIGMLAAVDFAVALAVSYLAIVQVAAPDEPAPEAGELEEISE